MRTCGIATASSDTVLVVLQNNSEERWELVDTSDVRKVALADHQDSQSLRDFSRTLAACLNGWGVDQVCLRACTYRGRYSSGAASLKMEGLIQVLELPIHLIAPQTIKAGLKEENIELPAGLKRYQADAFEAAVFGVLTCAE